jgi:hypothetical protein
LQLLNIRAQFVHLYLQDNPLKTIIIISMFCQTLLANTGYNHLFPEYFNKNIIWLMSHKWNSCLFSVDTLINLKIHDKNAAMDDIKVVCLAYTQKVTSLYSGQDLSSVMYFATLPLRKGRRLRSKYLLLKKALSFTSLHYVEYYFYLRYI